MKKLIVFSGSGVFFESDKSGYNVLASEFGKTKEAEKQEKHYKSIRLQKPWGLDVLAKFYVGISRKDIDKKAKEFVKNNLKKEAFVAVKDLKNKGFTVVCYSSDLINVLEALKQKLGLDDVYGNSLEFKQGKCTGKLKEKVDRYDRAKKLAAIVKKYKLSKKDVFVIGRSVTTIPCAKFGTIIALNPVDKKIKQTARFKINNLKQIWTVIKSFLIAIYLFVFGSVVQTILLRSKLMSFS